MILWQSTSWLYRNCCKSSLCWDNSILMNEITILPVNSTLGCLNSLIMAEILILLGKIPNFVLGNFTSFFSASHLYMFHRKLRFSLGEAQSICQCIEHACIWCIYIYTRIQIWSNTHIHLHTHIYIALYMYLYMCICVYIYISLSLSLLLLFIYAYGFHWFPITLRWFAIPHQGSGLRIAMSWSSCPPGGCREQAVPCRCVLAMAGMAWDAGGGVEDGIRFKQQDATSNLDLCNGNHGNQETTGIWATNMGVRESWGPPLFRSKFPRRMLPFASLRSLAVLTSRPHGRSFALFAAKLVDADALKHLVHKARQPLKLGRPLKKALSDKAFNATERGRWNLWRDLWVKPYTSYTRIYQVSLSFLRIYFHRFNLLCLRAL